MVRKGVSFREKNDGNPSNCNRKKEALPILVRMRMLSPTSELSIGCMCCKRRDDDDEDKERIMKVCFAVAAALF